MFVIDQQGKVINPRIQLAISPSIERGVMVQVNGIIVHQTDSPTAQSTLNSYQNLNANGAHFLIDKDGTIYQTASLLKQTRHVGKLRSRCLAETRCTPTELKALKKFNAAGEHKREAAKSVPDRYPANQDSVGIELVGKAISNNGIQSYEAVTKDQNDSLKWLIMELTATLQVPFTEIFRHPTASYKNPSEASTAQW